MFKYMDSDSHHWRMPLVTLFATALMPINEDWFPKNDYKTLNQSAYLISLAGLISLSLTQDSKNTKIHGMRIRHCQDA